jgi:ABC-type nickel/cobalt efflux system permease component RcnA
MSEAPELLLIGAVATVGVLHTIVPDHWVPIALMARQRGWSRAETARAALQAGTGHVLSTLLIAVIVWLAGVAFADRFGRALDTASSLALIGFGGWIAIAAWRELHDHGGHGHSHAHAQPAGGVHGPELHRIPTPSGPIELSIYETGAPPRFRLTGVATDGVSVETRRDDGGRQTFAFADRGSHWESLDEIPEPHQFDVMVTIEHGGHAHAYEARFAEHGHEPRDRARTPLLLILGSSPMVEGIPAFFAAGRYGAGLIAVMAVIFALSTIATYVVLCVYSTAGLRRLKLGAFERYGEVLSGSFIALVGVAFWIWPVL